MPYTANAAGINTAPEQHVVSDRSADNCFFSPRRFRSLFPTEIILLFYPALLMYMYIFVSRAFLTRRRYIPAAAHARTEATLPSVPCRISRPCRTACRICVRSWI